MTLLTVCQNVALEVGLSPAASIVGQTNNLEARLLAFAHRTGKDLKQAYVWPQLIKENLFSTASGTASYALPTDFESQLFDTNWDRTNQWQLVGPISAEEWQFRKSGISTASIRRRFRVKGLTSTQFFIDPTPTSIDSLVFEYISTNWILPKTWVTATAFAAGSYCSYNGNIYKTTAGGTTGATPPTHTTGSDSDGTVTWIYQNIVYDKFLADTDNPVFNEKLLELGIQWRFLQASGLEFQEKQSEFYDACKKEYVSIAGARTLSLVPQSNYPFMGPGSLPETGFGS